jgi:hypothetical protein
MTERKPRAAGRPTAEQMEDFERISSAELERMPTTQWSKMSTLWRWLPSADPATQKRLVALAIRLCHQHGESPPAALCDALDRLLDVGPARNHPRLRDEQLAAARYIALHPEASAREVARHAEVDHQLVLLWRKQPQFHALINEQRALHELRAREDRESYQDYVERRRPRLHPD